MPTHQPEAVKIGPSAYTKLAKFVTVYGSSAADTTRRALDMYIALRREPIFWRVAEKLNGRKLATVLIELLRMWVNDEIKLDGD